MVTNKESRAKIENLTTERMQVRRCGLVKKLHQHRKTFVENHLKERDQVTTKRAELTDAHAEDALQIEEEIRKLREELQEKRDTYTKKDRELKREINAIDEKIGEIYAEHELADSNLAPTQGCRTSPLNKLLKVHDDLTDKAIVRANTESDIPADFLEQIDKEYDTEIKKVAKGMKIDV